MGKCFMTIEKIKTDASLAGKYKHNYRKIDVPNADPELKHLNEELVSLDGETYREKFHERIKELGYGDDKKLRSNAVYGFEVVMTFSREDRENIDIEKWKEDNVKWLKQAFNANPEKYGDNVVSVMYHADEPGNVHLHAFVIPIDDKGRLNARYYVGNARKMTELQNSYAKEMKKHNLERGIEHTKATHKAIKRMYAALNMAFNRNLPKPLENETKEEYYNRVNEIYKDSVLKSYALEDKYNRLKLEQEQTIRNEVSKVKKEIYDKYQGKANQMEELEREFGTVEQIKEKCDNFDNLISGIAAEKEEKRPGFIEFINNLINIGKREKLKNQSKDKDIYEI